MNKKKGIMIAIVIVLVIIAGIGTYMLWNKQKEDKIVSKMNIIFQKDKTNVEYGEAVDSKSFVKNTVGDITSFPKVNTTVIGKQKLTYKLSYKDVKKNIHYEIIVKDTKAPVIEFKNDTITLPYGKEYNEQENIIKVYDPIDGTMKKSKEKQKESYWIESKLNTNKAGTYTIIVYAEDKNANEVKKSYKVIVEEKQEEKKKDVEKYKTKDITKTNSSLNKSRTSDTIQPYYVNGVLLVNKKHPLPRDYGGIDSTAYTALQSLQAGAQSAGYSMPLLSGYRSYDYQKTLYNNYVAQDGQALADTYSARPGNSEHQSGLAFDIGALDNAYGNTPEGKWLHAHCAQYGFILRFPAGKEAITGYQYEPWHVRYVGVDIASQIMKQGISLEEYLGE